MTKKWAILAVHGVGETGPGSTVDSLVSSLAVNRPNLKFDGVVEIRAAEDMRAPDEETKPELPTFPVHIRRAKILTDDPNAPQEAVFAEVYWADLSNTRDGAVGLFWGFMQTVFSLRFFTDQAAIMPVPTTPREAYVSQIARVIRFVLQFAGRILCGPIAALCTLLAIVLLAEVFFFFPLYPKADRSINGPTQNGMIALMWICAALGIQGWRVCRYSKDASNAWKRYWIWFAITNVLFALFLVFKDHSTISERTWGEFMHMISAQLRLSPSHIRDIPWVASIILFVIQSVFCFLAFTLLVAGVLWIPAFVLAPRSWRSALSASIGTSFAQLGLWLLIVPPVTILAIRYALTVGRPASWLEELLTNVRLHFVTHLVFSAFLGMVGAFIISRRFAWIRQANVNLGKAGPSGYPYPYLADKQRNITRLIVHELILGAILFIATAACSYAVIGFYLRFHSGRVVSFMGYLWNPRAPLSSVTIGQIDAITSLVISVFVLGSTMFAKVLRIGLHVLSDVINHFARRHDDYAWPWRQSDDDEKNRVFDIQRRIAHRFQKVLDTTLGFQDISHLTIISHSQGTMIAIDAFSMINCEVEQKCMLPNRLDQLDQFHFVTMGSPFTHLYQHYFPFRYPDLAHNQWTGLKSTLRQWVNVFRIDDYIGTHVTPDPDWKTTNPITGNQEPALLNVPIDKGGHVGYWRQPDVFQFEPVKRALPQ